MVSHVYITLGHRPAGEWCWPSTARLAARSPSVQPGLAQWRRRQTGGSWLSSLATNPRPKLSLARPPDPRVGRVPRRLPRSHTATVRVSQSDRSRNWGGSVRGARRRTESRGPIPAERQPSRRGLAGSGTFYDQDFTKIAEFGLTGCPPAQIDVSPDGAYVAMVSLDGEIELFTADGRRVASRKLGARNQANDILYRPDGLQLACTFGSTVFLLDAMDARC